MQPRTNLGGLNDVRECDEITLPKRLQHQPFDFDDRTGADRSSRRCFLTVDDGRGVPHAQAVRCRTQEPTQNRAGAKATHRRRSQSFSPTPSANKKTLARQSISVDNGVGSSATAFPTTAERNGDVCLKSATYTGEVYGAGAML